MLTKEIFVQTFSSGVHLLDCATGTWLRQAGMPRGCCMAEWVIMHPQPLAELQKACARAGSEIVYAPTFQAQPTALAAFGLQDQTELINEMLVSLSRSAAPGCLIAGNLTTLRGFMDTSDRAQMDRMTADYRRQIRALMNGGADLLAGETLLHPLEAEAILRAAEAENAGAVMISFAVKRDGRLFSGHDAAETLHALEKMGAAALGVNCVEADEQLPELVARLRSRIGLPLLCKPNAGRAEGSVYPVDEARFAQVMLDCIREGAQLVGGCCGTTPAYLAALKERMGE